MFRFTMFRRRITRKPECLSRIKSEGPEGSATLAPQSRACLKAGRRLSQTAWLAARHAVRSEEHTSELQSQSNLVCRPLLEKKKNRLNVLNIRHTREVRLLRYFYRQASSTTNKGKRLATLLIYSNLHSFTGQPVYILTARII